MKRSSLYLRESLDMAFDSLWHNKLRSFLTLLGVIIGVLTIIAVVSVIQGLNNYVYTRMSFYGANDFSVSKLSPFITTIKDYQEQMKRKDLTLDDMLTLRRLCRSCDLVGASVNTTRIAKFGSRSLKNVSIRGVTSVDHLIGSVLELERGRHFTRDDEDRSRYVCIIGADLAENLFPGLDPIGRWIKLGNQNFEIIGLGKRKGKLLGFSQDNYAWIPISTFMKLYGSRQTITINIHTSSQEGMARAMEEVRTILRSLRKRTYNQPDDFAFVTSDTFINFYKSATSGIYFAMIAISAIALLVGGIVIMNIMLVSVTERTKEIGIKMAVGARRRDVLIQFLIESAILSGVGGVIGILLGYLIARTVTLATSLPSRVDPVSIVLAIMMSTLVGLFFGIYPANRAARLNPVEALRSEQ